MTCPSCSAPVRPGALVCTSCWTDLPIAGDVEQPGAAAQDDAHDRAHATVGAPAGGAVGAAFAPAPAVERAPAAAPGTHVGSPERGTPALPPPAGSPLEPPPIKGRAGRAGRGGTSWSTPVDVWRTPAGLLAAPGPGAAAGPGAGPVVAPAARTNGLAIAALVLAVLWLGGLGSLLAVVLGVVVLRQLRRGDGRLGGRGLAIAGTALGGVGLVLTLILAALAIPTFLAAREAGVAMTLESSLRTAGVDQETAREETGSYTMSVPTAVVPGATLRVARADATSYCMEAAAPEGAPVLHLVSGVDAVTEGRCP